jgi:hypothetical protein
VTAPGGIWIVAIIGAAALPRSASCCALRTRHLVHTWYRDTSQPRIADSDGDLTGVNLRA